MTEITLLIVAFCSEFDRFEQCNKFMFDCYKEHMHYSTSIDNVSEICEELLPYEIWEGQE